MGYIQLPLLFWKFYIFLLRLNLFQYLFGNMSVSNGPFTVINQVEPKNLGLVKNEIFLPIHVSISTVMLPMCIHQWRWLFTQFRAKNRLDIVDIRSIFFNISIRKDKRETFIHNNSITEECITWEEEWIKQTVQAHPPCLQY